MFKFKFKVKTKEVLKIPDICLGFSFLHKDSSNSGIRITVSEIDQMENGKITKFYGVDDNSGAKSYWTSDHVLMRIRLGYFKYAGINVN